MKTFWHTLAKTRQVLEKAQITQKSNNPSRTKEDQIPNLARSVGPLPNWAIQKV